MNNQSKRFYRATPFSRNQFIRGLVILLLLFVIIVFIDLDQLRYRLFLYYGLVILLYIASYWASLMSTKKEYELVEIAKEGITIYLPTQEIVQIPWNKDISVGYYELRSVGISPSIGTKYELILSSEPLPPSYQFKQTEHFSPDKYYKGDTWQVSMNRGTKRWCQQQVEWIQNIKKQLL